MHPHRKGELKQGGSCCVPAHKSSRELAFECRSVNCVIMNPGGNEVTEEGTLDD